MASGRSESMLNRNSILLSVKPHYAQSILDGIKKYEFRKVRVRDDVDGMLLYASSPRRELVGYVEIDTVLEDSPHKLWSTTGADGGISRKQYLDYFKDKDCAYAIKVKRVHAFPQGIDPNTIFPDFKAPQSFMYINTSVIKEILESFKNDKKSSVRRRHSRSG